MKKGTGKLLLSICIPTYNRAEKLDRLLGTLSRELSGASGEAEICVSDNCSPDRTQAVLKKWAGKLRLSFSRNRENLGFDLNVIKALGLSRGEFCWLMSDDDVVVPGAVARLLSDIKKADGSGIGAICVANWGDAERRFFGKEFCVLEKNSRAYPPLLIGFIGTICLHAETAREVIKKKLRISGKMALKKGDDPHLLDLCVQTYLFLECIEAQGKFGIEPVPGIEFRADGTLFSYERKLWFNLVVYEQVYDIRKNYPWFNLCESIYYWRDHFLRAVMLAEKPYLERPLGAAVYSLAIRIMEIDGAHGYALALRALEAARRLPFAGIALRGAYSLFIARKYSKGGQPLMTGKQDSDPSLAKKIGFALARARKMCSF